MHQSPSTIRVMTRITILATCAAMILGCIQPSSRGNRADDIDALRALDAQWSRAVGAHDLDATVAFYAQNAEFLPPDEPLAADKAAIRASWVGAFAAFDKLSWKVKTIEVASSGDLAYLTGAWAGTLKVSASASIPVTGKFVEVWKKQSDGQWKCVADTSNSDAPATPPPAATK